MALATLFLAPWMLLGRLVELDCTTISPSTVEHSTLMMVSKYVPRTLNCYTYIRAGDARKSMPIGSWKEEWVRLAHRSEVHCGILTSSHCCRSHVETTHLHEYYWQKREKPFISAKWANTLLSAGMKFVFRVNTEKTNWNGSLSRIKRHSCPRDIYDPPLHLSEKLSFICVFLYCLLGLLKIDTV